MKKKLISHRGNIKGRIKDYENNPDYVYNTIKLGFECEVDVWSINNKLYLGHDNIKKNLYEIKINFLKNKKIWCHAKNKDALHKLINENIHCFWHQNDYFTLTSKNWLWCSPECKQGGYKTIIVLPELHKVSVKPFSGICSDYISRYV